MTKKQLKKLMGTDLPYSEMTETFSVFVGLEILRSRIETADITAAEHDIVYTNVSVKAAVNAGFTENEILVLRKNNWMLDDDNGLNDETTVFAKFV